MSQPTLQGFFLCMYQCCGTLANMWFLCHTLSTRRGFINGCFLKFGGNTHFHPSEILSWVLKPMVLRCFEDPWIPSFSEKTPLPWEKSRRAVGPPCLPMETQPPIACKRPGWTWRLAGFKPGPGGPGGPGWGMIWSNKNGRFFFAIQTMFFWMVFVGLFGLFPKIWPTNMFPNYVFVGWF